MYPCPCCGYLTMDEPPGYYSICPVCFWEDDALQLEFATTLAGGANAVSLAEAQRNFAGFGASEERVRAHVRAPAAGVERDPTWRPIDSARDYFPDWQSPDPERAPEEPEDALYYWRPSFWRRDRVT